MKENSSEEDIELLQDETSSLGLFLKCKGSEKYKIALEHILSDYKRVLEINEVLLKENEELKDKYATFVKMSSEVIANSIPVQKVKDKIEELKKNLYTFEHYETVGAINVLQELLKESEN